MVRFLKKLFTMFQSSPDLPDIVSNDEIICRYLDEKNRFSPKNKIVKKKAFEPDKKGKLSVYRNTELSHAEICDIGEEYVAKPKNKTLYGWGKLSANDILETKLKITADKTPHERHADLVNWPTEKDERLDVQAELCTKAELILK